MDETKNCPFCGGINVDKDGVLHGDGRRSPECMDCGATAESMDGWNSRQEGWVDVNCKLPKNTGRYWCYVRSLGDLGYSAYQWNVGYNEFDKKFNCDNGDWVTHWMPLPNLPKPKPPKK